MGIPVLILGGTGTGKTTSLRNFEENEITVYNVASKPLPFKKKFPKTYQAPNYAKITKSMAKNGSKTYIIDDSQYLLAFELFDKVNVLGYEKFTQLAVNFKQLITFVSNELPSDAIVYFLHHTETNEYGMTKAKTIGKMLDEKITVEGLFTIVLQTKIEKGQYFFVTQNTGMSTCKSPMEMFELEIDNDLKFVDERIREYYELGGKKDESTKQLGQR